MLKHLRQLALESLVYGLSGIAARFITVFLVPIYTRIFTPTDYGSLSLVNTTMSLIAIFVVLALDNSAHRWFWDTENEVDRKQTLASWAWCQFATASIAASVVLLFSNRLGRVVIGNLDAGLYFRIAAM